ncbi:MAG: trans-sulfuration enzyme family protein [Candidatus Thorarchaeota archaeon]|jgi:cystathionine gamma-lyase
MRFSTKAVHVGEEPNLKDGGFGDVVVPIHLSTTFARKQVDNPPHGYEYSRTGNVTRDALERKVAALETGSHAIAFSSGMAAEASLILSLLEKGDHVVAFDDLYGGTRRLFDNVLAKYGLEFTYVDARESVNVERAIEEDTKLVWLETPTNPLMRLCDIKVISEHASDRGVLTVVDNTFASPFFQRPLELGADIVIHSTTKYLGGHSDVVGGVVVVSDDEIHEKVRFNQNAVGAVSSPFDSYLVLRGIKTLPLRMSKHEENALRVAEFLESSEKVSRVYYPGLPSHSQYELASRQMSGYSGMLSFELEGDVTTAKTFLGELDIFLLAESLGGVESLIEHPASMTHAIVPEAVRASLGISDTLVRASVGIEDVGDLVGDLDRALQSI